MTTISINLERLAILKSGIVDSGSFNKKVFQIRKNFNIPRLGFPSLNGYQNYQKWKDKEKQKKLIEVVNEIINKTPDLNSCMAGILYNHILFKEGMVAQRKSYNLSIETKNDQETCKFEFSGHLDPSILNRAFESIKTINNNMLHLKPLNNLERDLKILKLSKNKGSKIKSNMPEIENDSTYNDEILVSEVFPENLDTFENLVKNRMLIRKRRSISKQRIKKLFPNTYKE